jgi:hypothetical protein
MEVSLNDTLVILELINVSRQVDSSALTSCFWLDDESLRLSLLPALMIGLQLIELHGQVPGDREELIVTRELSSEHHQIFAKVVLSGEDSHAFKC